MLIDLIYISVVRAHNVSMVIAPLLVPNLQYAAIHLRAEITVTGIACATLIQRPHLRASTLSIMVAITVDVALVRTALGAKAVLLIHVVDSASA